MNQLFNDILKNAIKFKNYIKNVNLKFDKKKAENDLLLCKDKNICSTVCL